MNKNRKILIITSNYPPKIGGVEKYSFDLYNNLKKRIGVDKISNSKGKKFIVFFAVYALLKTLINQRKYLVIHLCSGTLAPLGFLLKIFTHKKIFIAVHGLDITWSNKFYQIIIPWCIKRLDKVICGSNFTGKICEFYGIKSEKIKIINYGIDFENFDQNCMSKKDWAKKYNVNVEKKTIISVGRLIKRKGVTSFIENCLTKIKKINFHYFIIGDGPELVTITETIAKFKLEKKISILVGVDDKDLGAFYEYADLFVMPNIELENDIEGFGIVCIEAGSHGLPVLTSGIQGIKDSVIQDKSGFIYEDYLDCIRILNEFLDKKDLFKSRKFIKEFVEETFSWDKISKEYIKTYIE